jgi:hypothetical protein
MGTATLDWLPEHFDKYLSFTNHVEGYYAPEHSLSIRADEEVDELTIHLLPLEKLSGRVMLPDGRPAPGANVALRGQGTTHNGFHGGTSADDEGRFELAVYSEQAYLVVASHDELISPVKSDILVRVGQPVSGVELVLLPSTRLHGRVTMGPDERPAPNIIST